MYRCSDCGYTGDRPARIYEPDSSYAGKCEYCGSESISWGTEKCHICGETLYAGDDAFEAGDKMFCVKCVRKVMLIK